MGIGVGFHCGVEGSPEYRVQGSKLKGDSREYELDIATVSGSRAEKAGSKPTLVLAPLSDGLGQCRLPSAREAVDPQYPRCILNFGAICVRTC